MELFKLLFMFIYFLGRKLCKFSALLADSLNHVKTNQPPAAPRKLLPVMQVLSAERNVRISEDFSSFHTFFFAAQLMVSWNSPLEVFLASCTTRASDPSSILTVSMLRIHFLVSLGSVASQVAVNATTDF